MSLGIRNLIGGNKTGNAEKSVMFVWLGLFVDVLGDAQRQWQPLDDTSGSFISFGTPFKRDG